MKKLAIFSEPPGRTLGLGIDIGDYSISQHYTREESQLMHMSDLESFGPDFVAKYGVLVGIDQFEPNIHFSYNEKENKVFVYDSDTREAHELCSGEEFLKAICE